MTESLFDQAAELLSILEELSNEEVHSSLSTTPTTVETATSTTITAATTVTVNNPVVSPPPPPGTPVQNSSIKFTSISSFTATVSLSIPSLTIPNRNLNFVSQAEQLNIFDEEDGQSKTGSAFHTSAESHDSNSELKYDPGTAAKVKLEPEDNLEEFSPNYLHHSTQKDFQNYVKSPKPEENETGKEKATEKTESKENLPKKKRGRKPNPLKATKNVNSKPSFTGNESKRTRTSPTTKNQLPKQNTAVLEIKIESEDAEAVKPKPVKKQKQNARGRKKKDATETDSSSPPTPPKQPRPASRCISGRKKKTSEMTEEERLYWKNRWREESRLKRQRMREKMSESERRVYLDNANQRKRELRQQKRNQMSEKEKVAYSKRLSEERKKYPRSLKQQQQSQGQVQTQTSEEKKREESQGRIIRRLERLARMTDEELEELKQKKALSHLERMARMSEKEMEEFRKKRGEYGKRRYASLTEDEKKRRIEMKRKYRENLAPDKKRKMLEGVKKAYKKRMENVRNDPNKLKELKLKWKEDAKKRLDKVHELKRSITNSDMDKNWREDEANEVNRSRPGRKPKNPLETPQQKLERLKEEKKMSNLRQKIRRRMKIREMVDNGMEMKDIHQQMETSQQRERRLMRNRINRAKITLRKQLEENGAPPEEIERKLKEVRENYEPKRNFRPYIPRRKNPLFWKLKEKDPTETEMVSDEAGWTDDATVEVTKKAPQLIIFSVPAMQQQPNQSVPVSKALDTEGTHSPSLEPFPMQQVINTLNYPEPEDIEDNFEDIHSPSEELNSSKDKKFHTASSSIQNKKEPRQRRPRTFTNLPDYYKTGVPRGPKQKLLNSIVRDSICEICGNAYRKEYLQDHKNTMHNPHFRDSKCQLCGLEFKKSKLWYKHYRLEHLQLPPKTSSSTTNSNSNLPPPKTKRKRLTKSSSLTSPETPKVLCSLCGESFANLKVHEYFQHGEGANPTNFFKCPLCPSKKFKRKTSLESHLIQHHKEYAEERGLLTQSKCDLCSETFPKWEDLPSHIKDKHQDSYFPCNDCNAVKYSKVAWKFHVTRCPKVKKDVLEGLRKEWKEKGEPASVDRYPIKCEFCPREVILMGLARHYMEVHRLKEDREFKCPDCSKYFKRRDYFVCHLESVHKWKLEDAMEICRPLHVLNREEIKVHNQEGKLIMPRGKARVRKPNEMSKSKPKSEGISKRGRKKAKDNASPGKTVKLEEIAIKNEDARERPTRRSARRAKKVIHKVLNPKSDQEENSSSSSSDEEKYNFSEGEAEDDLSYKARYDTRKEMGGNSNQLLILEEEKVEVKEEVVSSSEGF